MREALRALIDAHLTFIEGPACVASLMEMSYHTLRRRFRQETHMSPLSFPRSAWECWRYALRTIQ